jgi:hypoxanthine phosphoribosyltransferase
VELPRELIDEERIAERVRALGEEIAERHRGHEVHLLGILRGCFVFLADLARCIDLPTTVDFIALSSYGEATESSGVVKLEIDLGINIANRHVIVVEDIVDTGLTLRYLTRNLATRDPAGLEVCSLLEKPARREVEVDIDYLGFEIPDEFVVGYGLDHAQLYRNLPYIGVMPGPSTGSR